LGGLEQLPDHALNANIRENREQRFAQACLDFAWILVGLGAHRQIRGGGHKEPDQPDRQGRAGAVFHLPQSRYFCTQPQIPVVGGIFSPSLSKSVTRQAPGRASPAGQATD